MLRLLSLFLLVPNLAYAYGVGGLIDTSNPIIAIGIILCFILIIGGGISFAIKEPAQAIVLIISFVGPVSVTYGYIFMVMELLESEEGIIKIIAYGLTLVVMFKSFPIFDKLSSILFPTAYKKVHDQDS